MYEPSFVMSAAEKRCRIEIDSTSEKTVISKKVEVNVCYGTGDVSSGEVSIFHGCECPI
jgi:hypothetical protein